MTEFRLRLSLPRVLFILTGLALIFLSSFPVVDLFGGISGKWPDRAIEWVRGTFVIVALAIAAALISESGVDRLVAWAERTMLRPSSRTFAIIAGVAAVAICAVVSWYCFSHQATTGDEMSMRFQARLFASGRLFAIPEAQREFFNTPQALDAQGKWFSQFPIGWPALLGIGMMVGLEWMVAPIVTAIAVIAFYRFVRQISTESMARWSTLLMILSPWVFFLGGSQENHMAAAALTVIALAALPRWLDATTLRQACTQAAIIGGCVSAMAAVRPYDAALVAVVIGGFQLIWARRSRVRWLSFAAQLVAGLIPLAIMLYVNSRTTGDPFLFAYDALNGALHRPGFHMSPRGFPHTPRIGLLQTSGSLIHLNFALFEWPIPTVVVVAAAMIVLPTPTRWDLLMLALMLAMLLGYAAYWAESYFAFGPRFLLPAVPAFIWFAAKMPGALASRLRVRYARQAILLIFPIATLAAWRPTMRPWRGSGVLMRATALHNLGRTEKLDIDRVIRASGVNNALIFVNESWRARLLARLRVMGLPPSNSGHVVDLWDACALQRSLDAEDARPGSNAADALNRVAASVQGVGQAMRDPAAGVSFVPAGDRDAACMGEQGRNAEGTLPFATFLAHQRFGSDGRLGGPVVFAVDYGARNERLRERFGARSWYRLTMRMGADTTFELVPYSRPR